MTDLCVTAFPMRVPVDVECVTPGIARGRTNDALGRRREHGRQS